MIKKHTVLLLNVLCLSSIALKGMENTNKGPMNSEWFYDKTHAFAQANDLHQKQNWKDAYNNYIQTIILGSGSEPVISPIVTPDELLSTGPYKIKMAFLNAAACLMAQGEATDLLKAFDELINIPEKQKISPIVIKVDKKKETTILVRTDLVGIGDIFHFLSAVGKLKDDTGWEILLQVPQFLKQTLNGAAEQYKCALYGNKEDHPCTNYETHLIALLGHLELTPAQMNPAKVMFTVPERAINAIVNLIKPLKGKPTIAIVDRGEVGRTATLIGGRILSDRHLDSEPFNALLNNHPDLVLLDCGKNNNSITLDAKHENRRLVLPAEKYAFDIILALGNVMSGNKRFIAFGPDMGQTNVFIRSLEDDAQNRMAFIIPNAKEHDMRMSGKGSVYKHMISNCWVYKCTTRENQTEVIEQAYQDLIKY